MSRSAAALNGVRGLDLTDASGAYCGKLLADMGADVIAIEPPGGTAMREINSFRGEGADRNRSSFFWHYSTNKRSITLDLEQLADRDRFLQLVATADLVVESFAPGRLAALGLGYPTLMAHNPRLTLVSITPFGQTGPYRDFRGSDLVCQAMGGMVYVNGAADEAPLQGFGLQAYHSAAAYAAIAAMLALLVRERSGRGQWIDVSVQECVATCVEHASSFFHQDGTIAERHGTLHWTRYFRVGRCTDGYVMHCTLGDWTSLAEWVRADGKAQDLVEPAWDDPNHRREHCDHLFDVLDEWASLYSVAELVEGAQLRRLPYAAVLPPTTLSHNEQLQNRGFFVPVQHDELGRTLTYPGAPYVFSKTPWRIRRRPPLVGEHTAQVLEEVQHRAQGSQLTASEMRQHLLGQRALEGIRIVDFTWVVAGPVATRILADHGAEVIKIERRDTLDLGSRRSGLTGNLNRGKQSIVINMASAQGVDLARQLIAKADVVIDNFSARVMRHWGLDYEELCRIKPDIIAVSMSGFGHTGPWKDYVSYGPTLQALAGYTFQMRHPNRAPAGWGFSYSDMAGGYSGALATLFALWHRQRTGEGQHVDVSQFENLVALLGPFLLDDRLCGEISERAGATLDNRSQEMPGAPHGVYRCANLSGNGAAHDRWCAIAVFGDDDWARFGAALACPAWTQDARFKTHAARNARRAELDTLVTSWTRRRTAETVMMTLQQAGVAAGIVANAEDLCRRDPHLQARGYWERVASPEGGSVEYDGVPFIMSETPGRIDAPGPLLGEHTESVLRRVLGLTTAAVAALRADDTVR